MSILNPEDINKLEAKISALEKLTSAELKIIFCRHAWLGLHQKASQLFKNYKLDKNQERNTVLILVVEQHKELLIYGDTGIHQLSPTQHWPLVRDAILEEFKNKEYYIGLSKGIEMIAANLIAHFPTDKTNRNEVSNEIIFI
jgi:uncharacterized membrane protein